MALYNLLLYDTKDMLAFRFLRLDYALKTGMIDFVGMSTSKQARGFHSIVSNTFKTNDTITCLFFVFFVA